MHTKKKLLLIGAGSVGGHLACNLDEYVKHVEIIGFLDDNQKKIGKQFCGHSVLGKVDDIKKFDREILIAICFTDPSLKRILVQKIKRLGFYDFPKFISEKAWISKEVSIQEGSIIYPGCCINYNTTIEEFVIVNMGCSIGHDCTIGAYTNLSPNVGIGGSTLVGESVSIGIGASVLQGINVGSDSVIGGQAMIIKDSPIGSRIVGVPGNSL